MVSSIHAIALLLAAQVAANAGEPRPSSCLIQPDKSVAVKRVAGRVVYCGLDIGSRTVKLSVVPMEKDRNTTIRDERQCRRSLGMGALVFDSKTSTARALPAATLGSLVDTIREYREICAKDGGRVVAAGATQWARDATNMPEIQARVKAETGVEFDVLTAQLEGEYSYVAASVHTPGRLVLDPGSNSFEIAWQQKGSSAITSILVRHGYVRAAANEFATALDYPQGRAAYQATAKAGIEEELAKLRPAMSLGGLRSVLSDGRIGPELLALGKDGAAHLAVRGLLLGADGRWITETKAHEELLARQVPTHDPQFGMVTAAPVTPRETAAYLDSIQPGDLKVLMSEPVRSLYGEHALVVPALVDLLFRELRASRLVMVPQEITTGHILSKLGSRASTRGASKD